MKYTASSDVPLILALAELSPQSSKTTLRSWLKEGRVAVDGEVVKIAMHIVHAGQEVTLGTKARFTDRKIQIYYEDRHLVVIEKPAGLLSVATAFEKGETAHGLLKDYYRPQRVFVVHRLDQDTSGVMVFALSEEGRNGLKDMFERHAMERVYVAIVEGKVEVPSGTWQSYLYEDELYTVHETDDPDRGTLAITHFRVLETSKRHTWLELRLETGKKNQIRVHCQSAGHPVVGDKKYGSSGSPIKRLCLHAQKLEFIHPVTGQPMKFKSQVPELFQRVK